MKILVIEDENAFRQVIVDEMEKANIETIGVGTGKDGLKNLEDHDFDIVVTDLRLPDIDGIEIIKRTRKAGDETPFLLMTAFASVKTAVLALQSGAADYLIKPLRVADLLRRVHQIYDLDNLKRENRVLRRIVQRDPNKLWYPESEVRNKIEKIISKVSNTDLIVLINGDTGTGKGVTARLIHSTSNRLNGPFLTVNCGAIPENLVESELFGHIKGAFTGADTQQDGLFVAASGGTLFLDEIADLPLSSQVKLLHVLEDKVVRPVGSAKTKVVDVRIIAATNQNLEEMVGAGKFRRDLYYRLNVVQISLPSLKDQKENIGSVMQFFIDKYARKYNFDSVKIDPDVWDVFNRYDWPGNFRELDNTIECSLLLNGEAHITINDIPPYILGQEVNEEPCVGRSFKDLVHASEKQIILHAIKMAAGDRREAAKNLQIGLSTLYRKLEQEDAS